MTTEEENELICEKLLGWQLRVESIPNYPGNRSLWLTSLGSMELTPTFTTWAEAGLILEALMGEYNRALSTEAYDAISSLGRRLANGTLTPDVIRSAALVYLRVQK